MKRVVVKAKLAPQGQREDDGIPDDLRRGPGNSRPSWLTGPGKACYVLSPEKQAEKTRDQEVREQVLKESQERKDIRYKNRVAKRRSTPRDLTGLVWNARRNRFDVEGQINIERAIKESVEANPIALYNDIAANLKNVAPIKAKDAKKLDLVAACKELWDRSQLQRRTGLVTNGKVKVKTPRPPRPPGAPRPKKEPIKETAKIKVVVKSNPFSQKAGNRYATYELVKKSKTYGEFLKKGGDAKTFDRILGFKTIAIEENGK
jgi:hypothetical protein